jgi:hypothetical protein
MGRKWILSVSKYYLGIYTKGLRETAINHIQIRKGLRETAINHSQIRIRSLKAVTVRVKP